MRYAVLALMLLPAVASARPVEDGTRITLFAGGRYVPHQHFLDEARDSGTPVTSDSPLGFEGMLSFSYAPSESLELSLEVGYASDRYVFKDATITLQNAPLVATLRWFPLATKLSPYLGAGAGYMLGFVGGAPSKESETHAQEFHAVAGAIYELSPAFWLCLEDRFQLAAGDIVPIGQVQTGGNAVMLGLTFVLEPAKDMAPH